MTVQISLTRENDHKQSVVATCKIPSSWSELDPKQRVAALTILLNEQDEGVAKYEIIKMILDLKPKVFKQLPNSLISEIAPLLDWCKIEPNYVPIFDEVKVQNSTVKLLKAGFENALMFQFAYCDFYFYKFQNEPNKESLIGLLASMAAKSIEDIDEKIQLLQHVEDVYLIAALNFFIGVKKYLAEVYIEIFDAVEANENEVIEVPNPIFNWHSTAEDIAETNIFGNKDAVMMRNVHEIFLYLRRKKQEAAEMKRLMKQSNND